MYIEWLLVVIGISSSSSPFSAGYYVWIHFSIVVAAAASAGWLTIAAASQHRNTDDGGKCDYYSPANHHHHPSLSLYSCLQVDVA